MTDESSGKSVGSLLSAVVLHLGNLVRGEISLARAEMAENLRGAAGGLGIIVCAMILAQAAMNVLAAALLMALAERGFPPAWSALAAGALFGLLAFLFLLKGVAALRLSSLRPTRTVRNVQKDAETLKEVVRNDPSI